jgi:hypothetical protein
MDPVFVPTDAEDPAQGRREGGRTEATRDDIPEHLRDSGPKGSQFGLKALFGFTTLCSCYFAVERFSNGRAAAFVVGFGIPLVWLFFLSATIAERLMAVPGLILLAVIICGLVLWGALLTYGF